MSLDLDLYINYKLATSKRLAHQYVAQQHLNNIICIKSQIIRSHKCASIFSTPKTHPNSPFHSLSCSSLNEKKMNIKANQYFETHQMLSYIIFIIIANGFLTNEKKKSFLFSTANYNEEVFKLQMKEYYLCFLFLCVWELKDV